VYPDDPNEEKLRKVIMNGDGIKILQEHNMVEFLNNVKHQPIFSVQMPSFTPTGNSVKEIEDVFSPFNLSIAMQNNEIFEFLVKDMNIAMVNERTPHLGLTSWHIAASRNNKMFEDMWKMFNASPNFDIVVLSAQDHTPLMFAARFSSVKNVRFILDNSRYDQISIVDKGGNNARFYALNYYTPPESSQRVARELRQRSKDMGEMFDEINSQSSVVGNYLEKLRPFSPALVASLHNSMKQNSSKRISKGNVQTLADQMLHKKNSTAYTSIMSNAKAVKKLEKLVIALESKPMSESDLNVLMDILKLAPDLLPKPHAVRFETGDNAIILADLREMFKTSDDAQLKAILVDIVVSGKVKPRKAVSFQNNSHAFTSPNVARPQTPPQQQRQVQNNATGAAERQRIIQLLVEMYERDLLSFDDFTQAKMYAVKTSKAAMSDLRNMLMQLLPIGNNATRNVADQSLSRLIDAIILHNNTQTLMYIDPSFNAAVLGSKEGIEAKLALDIRVIWAKLPRASPTIDTEVIEKLVGPVLSGLINERAGLTDALYAELESLALLEYQKFVQLKNYIDLCTAAMFIAEQVEEKMSGNSNVSMVLMPISRMMNLDTDPMKWTLKETMDIFQRNGNSQNINEVEFTTMKNAFGMFLDAFAQFYLQEYILVSPGMRQRIAAWIQNMNLIMELSDKTYGNNAYMKRVDKFMNNTWEQIAAKNTNVRNTQNGKPNSS
jgi:hypothetical protein